MCTCVEVRFLSLGSDLMTYDPILPIWAIALPDRKLEKSGDRLTSHLKREYLF
jgi:hypothetical protein